MVVIIVPIAVFTNLIEWFFKAIKWVVFIDNAETGLPWQTEILVKGIVEGIITIFSLGVGINKKNPWVIILSIILGFLACVAIYAICKYIIWILLALVFFLTGFVISIIIKKKDNEKTENKE